MVIEYAEPAHFEDLNSYDVDDEKGVTSVSTKVPGGVAGFCFPKIHLVLYLGSRGSSVGPCHFFRHILAQPPTPSHHVL